VSPELIPWVALAVLVVGMLALDLFVFHRDAHEVSLREAAAWSAVWIGLGLAFGGLVFATRGAQAGGEYLAGYLIEKSLSMDNVFVFAMIFGYFAVPARYQHRVLFWGVVGAIVFRAIFIAAGAALLEAFHFLIYGFGLLLLFTGWKMWRSRGHGIDPARNPVLRVVRRIVPSTDEYHGQRFFVRHAGRLLATPLFAVLVVVESSDIMFAIDSIPAIFAVTTDPFIVFTSNVFAILGLRSLYFLLAGMIGRFVYLKQGLAALLVFAGAKILVSGVYKLPVAVSLAVILAILAVSILASIVVTRRRGPDGSDGDEGSTNDAPDPASPPVPAAARRSRPPVPTTIKLARVAYAAIPLAMVAVLVLGSFV
jgi:tellurite resistance protein TerC